MSFFETLEYQELKAQQDIELNAALNGQLPRSKMRRLTIKHVNQFKRQMKKWAKKEARK